MPLDQFDKILIITFFIGCVFLSLFTFKKVKNIREYALGKTTYSLPIMVGTIFATSISSYSTIGTIEKVICCGIFFIITFSTKPVFFILMGAILSKGANRFKECLSISDIMTQMYGKTSGIITAVLAIIMSIGMVSIQIFAITSILKFVRIDSGVYLIFAPLCFILYSAFGGIRVVSIIDLFKFLIFFTVLPISCIKCLLDINGIDGIYSALGNSYFSLKMTRTELFSLISILLFNAIPGMTPPIIQRSLMLQTKEQIVKAFTISGVLTIPLFAMIALIGLSAKAKGLSGSHGALAILLSDNQYGLRALVLIGLFAIIISTADSYLNTAGIIFTRSILKNIKTSFESLRMVRISNLLIGCAAIPISMSGISIVDFFVTINNFWIPIVLVPMMVGYCNFCTVNKNIFFVSVFGCIIFSIAGYFYVGNIGAFTTLAGVLGSGFATWIYTRIFSPVSAYSWPKVKIREYFFIANSGCLAFSLWSLLFCIWGCITLFYTDLVPFFIVGAMLSVAMLLSEHIVKNNLLLIFITSLLWHVLWGMILFCVACSLFIIEPPIFSLCLCILSGIAVCYVLSNIKNIVLAIFFSLIIGFYSKISFVYDAHPTAGICFISGIICLSFLTVIFAWLTVTRKNINLNEEIIDVERINDIKNDAEKKFVASMYSALNELVINGGSHGGFKTLPIKMPVRYSAEQISLLELCKDLRDFISLDAAKMNINFEVVSNVEKINLNISNAYLYQLLFSLIYNMIYLVNTGCTIEVELNLEDNGFHIKLKYSGINFSKDELIRFTKRRKFVNVFILNFNDILDCLRDINASYIIEKNPNGGIITISKSIYQNVVRLSNL